MGQLSHSPWIPVQGQVTPTEAGERLLQTVGPWFDEIEAELAALTALRTTPAGTIRITTPESAFSTILWPAVETLLHNYPDIKVEMAIDAGLTDIVAERYDTGVRLGEQVAKDGFDNPDARGSLAPDGRNELLRPVRDEDSRPARRRPAAADAITRRIRKS